MLAATPRPQVEQLRLPAGHHGLALLPALLPRIELVEAVADDGDGQGDDEHAEDGAEAAQHLSEPGDGTDIAVADLKDRQNWRCTCFQTTCRGFWVLRFSTL